jgi:murein DD-endopeptidase MepM/ murein hydrolase activator NlpD
MRSRETSVGLVILSILLWGVFFVTPALAQETEALEEEKRELEEELGDLNKKIEEYQKELGAKSQEVLSLKDQIAIINTRIGKLTTEIRRTQTEISSTQIGIRETEISISEAAELIEENKKTIAELLRRMQSLDNESLLEQMLKYDSIAEALAAEHRLMQVQSNLTVFVEETIVLKSELEGEKLELGEYKLTLEEKNEQLAVQKSAEDNEKAHRDEILKVTQAEEQRYRELLTQAQAERAEHMARLAAIEQQILIDRNFLSYFRAGEIPPRGTKIFLWPEDGAVVTQSYGMTAFASRGAYGGQGHNGIDMSSGLASPIRAAAGGKVVARGPRSCTDYVDRSCNGYWGNWVAVEHPGGLVTLYAHMTKPSTKSVGSSVDAGDIIGYEGATGNVTGPHLHFTVYREFFTYPDPATGETRFSYNMGKTLNPLDYL